MRAVFIALGLALASTAATLACGGSTAADPCANAPTFARDLRPGIVEDKCIACHSASQSEALRRGAPAGMDFDTYEKTEPNRNAFVDAITSGRQPPADFGRAATEAERELVSLWRDCGFKP